MANPYSIPVRMRIGSGEEYSIAYLAVSTPDEIAGLDLQLVALLRATADEIEQKWREVNPDAPAHL